MTSVLQPRPCCGPLGRADRFRPATMPPRSDGGGAGQIDSAGVDPDALAREYLLLGLRFDRIESGYVDSFTGDPALRQTVSAEPAPDPADLVRQARRLIAAIPDVPHRNGFDRQRADYVAAHLRALECAGRKFAGEDIGFVDEVQAYFDVHISKGATDTYRQAHARLDEALGGSGPLADRMEIHRVVEEIPPEKLAAGSVAFF